MRLDPDDPRSAGFAQILDGLRRQRLQVYLEVDPATDEFLVTDLTTFTTPLIRYRIGDQGSIGNSTCRHGLGVLSSLDGRSMDVLEIGNGRRISALIFAFAPGDFPEVRRFQIWQPNVNRLQVLVECVDPPPAEEIRRRLRQHLEGVDVEIIWVESVPPAASGKLRLIVRDREYTGPGKRL